MKNYFKSLSLRDWLLNLLIVQIVVIGLGCNRKMQIHYIPVPQTPDTVKVSKKDTLIKTDTIIAFTDVNFDCDSLMKANRLKGDTVTKIITKRYTTRGEVKTVHIRDSISTTITVPDTLFINYLQDSIYNLNTNLVKVNKDLKKANTWKQVWFICFIGSALLNCVFIYWLGKKERK